jgi:hypothetical protein
MLLGNIDLSQSGSDGTEQFLETSLLKTVLVLNTSDSTSIQSKVNYEK